MDAISLQDLSIELGYRSQSSLVHYIKLGDIPAPDFVFGKAKGYTRETADQVRAYFKGRSTGIAVPNGVPNGAITVDDLAIEIGYRSVSPLRLAALRENIPQPEFFAGKKYYAQDQAEVVRAYFKGRKPWQR